MAPISSACVPKTLVGRYNAHLQCELFCLAKLGAKELILLLSERMPGSERMFLFVSKAFKPNGTNFENG